MPLSPAERAAGKRFRTEQAEALKQLNAESPPSARCSPYSPPWFRHPCPPHGTGTYAMPLKTRAVYSPEYVVDNVFTPPGRFLFSYLEGDCRSCGFTVRSGTGYLIVSEE